MTEHGSAPHGPGGIDREIDVRAISRLGIWLAAVTVASFVVGWLFYHAQSRSVTRADPPPAPIAAAREAPLPPGPHLQARPENELRNLRASERHRLDGWGWVDRDAGIAHVPVAVAIDLVVAEAQAAMPASPDESPAAD